MKINLFRLKTRLCSIVVFIALFVLTFGIVPPAHAAALTAMKDTLTREHISTVSNHTIVFTTPSGIASGNSIVLTFPAGFNIASVVMADVTVQAVAVTSATPSGQVLTIGCGGSNVVSAAGTATIAINNTKITNPASAGSYIVSISTTLGDTGSFAIPISTDDQVVVGTTVGPYISFALTTTSVTLTTAGGGGANFNSTAYNRGVANTLAASTNSATGYSISYNGATLTSGSYTISAIGATKAASSIGNEQFGINLVSNTIPTTGANESGGNGNPAVQYDTQNQYAFVAGTTTPLASASGTTSDTTYTVTYIANVNQTTEPAAYSTTITYICTGNF